MNKTIIININGIVFHIEEDAYEILKTYMTEVKRHFAYSTDSEEIVTDIENRLAEMFSERLNTDNRQVIITADVESITERMGNVSDFDIENDDQPSGVNSRNYYHTERKLFRDTDDRIISGVCSGLAHYFSIEPRWIRLLAIISIFFGFGIPVYIILWLVIPKATTRADKMAMKGEPINIQTLKKNFDEEFEGLKHGLKNVHQEAKPIINQLIRFIGKAGMLLVKIIGGIILFSGIIALFALGVGFIIFLGYWNSNQLNTFPFNLVNPGYKSVLTISGFFLIFVPLTSLVLFAARVIFTRFAVSQTVYFGMLILWLSALVVGVYHASKVGAEFNEEAKFSVTSTLKPSSEYYLKLNPVRFLTKEDSLEYNINASDFKERIIVNSRRDDFDQPRNVSLKIIKADVKTPVLIQEFSARGFDFETALANAKSAEYHFLQTDSILLLDENTHIKRGELWRDQRVQLTLKIPENTVLHIESGLNRYLEDYNLWECQPVQTKNDYLSEWIMTAEGLKCRNDSLFNKSREAADSVQTY